MTGQPYFDAKLFRFLRQLGKTNDRQWFQANKQLYEKDVRDPMLRFISAFGPRLTTARAGFSVAAAGRGGGTRFVI